MTLEIKAYVRALYEKKCELIYEKYTPWLNKVLGIPFNYEQQVSLRADDMVDWFKKVAAALVESYIETYRDYKLPIEGEDVEYVLQEVVRITNLNWDMVLERSPNVSTMKEYMMEVSDKIVRDARRELFIAAQQTKEYQQINNSNSGESEKDMDRQKLTQLLSELLDQIRTFKYKDFPQYSYREMEFITEPTTEWIMCTRRIENVVELHFKKNSSIFRAIKDGYGRATAIKDKGVASFESAKTKLTEGLELAIKAVEDDKFGELIDVSPTTNNSPIGDKIFIGHGGSKTWVELKAFLQDRLKLQCEEFNRESPAGKTTKERLEEMLNASCFAFLVMTAEDVHADNTFHARENVIHEVGLFQGKLGFNKAIVLLEEDCQEFSNIHGLGQIRFSKGLIKTSYEEIRQVLEREGILH